MTYTQNRSKKLLKNKNMCTAFFFIQTTLSFSLLQFPISAMPLPKIKQFFFSFSFYFGNVIATNQLQQIFFLLFRQCHCHKFIPTIFSPLFRQCHCHKFIPTIFCPLFQQCHCHKPIAIFFFLYFGNAIATNQLQQFSPYFGNGIATNQLQQFFFLPISAMPLPQIHSTFFF